MSWKFIAPQSIDPQLFGLKEVYALKVKRYDDKRDIRCFGIKGWKTIADLTDIDPRMGRQLNRSEWFVFAAKGRRETPIV
jgi:hypothetical protein